MDPRCGDKYQVSPARAEEQVAALGLFFQHVAPWERELHIQRVLALVDRGDLPPNGLLVCRRGGICLGAIAALPMPGAAGLVWPPQVVGEDARVAIEDLLVQAAITWLRQGGAKIVQALFAPTDTVLAGPLLRNGFRPTTTLLYLQNDLDGLRQGGEPARQLRCQSYASCDDATFRATLLASYDDTLDCPELNGLRSAEEIVAGYRAVPGCRLDQWWLAWHDDTPVGVLITLPGLHAGTLELAYLGLVPAARRRGWGMELTRRAMALASAEGSSRLTLTVDERNAPARAMYGALGFYEAERREVYLAIL